jgi:hypothetical protein
MRRRHVIVSYLIKEHLVGCYPRKKHLLVCSLKSKHVVCSYLRRMHMVDYYMRRNQDVGCYLTFSHSPFILAMAFSRANSLLAEEEISCSLSPSRCTPASGFTYH